MGDNPSQENKPATVLPDGESKLVEKQQPDENVTAAETALPENKTGAAELPLLLNLQPETSTDMEVHHHTHAPHGKKTWKHYFWEFLMLFLAVFCGFLAEYQLEHMIEKEKGKQYIQSLYEDLKTDTARLSFLLAYNTKKLTALNNMFACYDTVSKNSKASTCLVEMAGNSMSNRTFQITDRTLKQLSNAGGFRLLNKTDADSIIAYESSFNAYQNFESTVFQETQDNLRNTFNMLADFKANAELSIALKGNIADTMNSKISIPILFTSDKGLLNKYFNELLLYRRVTLGQQNLLEALKIKATTLILFYENRHHLKEID